jgi:hypothetical protein
METSAVWPCSPSAYRLARFAQRNRLAVALACLLLLGAIGGAAFMGWQARRTTQAREMAALRDLYADAWDSGLCVEERQDCRREAMRTPHLD